MQHFETEDFISSTKLKKEKLSSHVERKRFSYFLAFWVIGVINNNGYTMVQAGSSAIAEEFNKKSMMGLFLFLMIGSGVISRYVNGACCVNISHIRRMLMVTVFSIFSFLTIAMAAENT